MRKSTKLRHILSERRAVMAPGAHDVLSAKLIEKSGFEVVQASGFGLAATVLGLPDMAFISFGEMLELTRNIATAVEIPLMADADTGFGNAINAMFVTRKYIEAGCAGMNIEDQTFPKRCGHLEGKNIISTDEMVLKIKACKEVRDKLDPEFIINARTDAIAVEGIEKAIERGNAYLDAGADMIFVEAPRHIEDIQRAVKEIHGLVSVNFFDAVVGGKTPLLPVEDLKDLGVARISVPVGPLFAAVKGMSDYLAAVKEGRSKGHQELTIPFADYKKLVGFDDLRELEKKYLPIFIDNNR